MAIEQHDAVSDGSEAMGLRAGQNVRGARGKLLGEVADIVRDSEGGEPVAFVVKHGLFGRKRKRLPAHVIQRVDGETVTLRFTIDEFKELPDGTVVH